MSISRSLWITLIRRAQLGLEHLHASLRSSISVLDKHSNTIPWGPRSRHLRDHAGLRAHAMTMRPTIDTVAGSSA